MPELQGRSYRNSVWIEHDGQKIDWFAQGTVTRAYTSDGDSGWRIRKVSPKYYEVYRTDDDDIHEEASTYSRAMNWISQTLNEARWAAVGGHNLWVYDGNGRWKTTDRLFLIHEINDGFIVIMGPREFKATDIDIAFMIADRLRLGRTLEGLVDQ